MGIYDRDYSQPGDQMSSRGSMPGLSQLTPVVKYFLIINAVVFLFTMIANTGPGAGLVTSALSMPGTFILNWMVLDTFSFSSMAQLWRIITYQFIHADFLHILFNMLGLYFLGPTLERFWGSRRFAFFYLLCGAVGGVCFMLLSGTGLLSPGTMVGASGAILGLLAACAIMFPQFVVFFLIFPVPIRIASVILIAMYVFNVVRGLFAVASGSGQIVDNVGGDVAHLAGMATGAIYVLISPALERFQLRHKSSLWEKKMSQARDLQGEVDRILEKVHQSGIQSLTKSEKRTLEQATRREQMRNRI